MPDLIITADDCGLSEGINDAVVSLYEGGYINSASVMTNFPAHENAFEQFRALSNLEVGAHLTLSDGSPVTDILSPSPITDENGAFRHKMNMYSRLLVPSDEAVVYIRHELEAQLRKFTDAGLQPQHITTHRHFHTVPALRKIIYELAIRYEVKWVRAHEFRATIAPYTIFTRPQIMAGDLPFDTPAYISPLKHWMGRDPAEYASKLLEFDEVIEIVVHPSTETDKTFPDVEYSPSERHQEMLYLMQVIDALRQRQAQTVGTI